MDPALWPDPLQFRPERHLDSHGKVIKSEYLVTFGLGKLYLTLSSGSYYCSSLSVIFVIQESGFVSENQWPKVRLSYFSYP